MEGENTYPRNSRFFYTDQGISSLHVDTLHNKMEWLKEKTEH